MPYSINGHTNPSEALPGKGEISHQFFPHYYALKCGDVYLVTVDGNITFIGVDSEASNCVWNSREQGLYPNYYRPVHGSREGAYANCLEETQNPQFAYTEDCLMVLLNPVERLHQRTNQCVIFRHGTIIYQGYCDCRGVFYNHSRGGSNLYQTNVPTIRSEYQWRRASLNGNGQLVDDPNGKYCGAGTVLDKTWDWVTLKSYSVSQTDVMEKYCGGWIINGSPKNTLKAWYTHNCLCCVSDCDCDTNPIPADNGQFAKHNRARNFSTGACTPQTGDDLCYCRMSNKQGIDYVDNEVLEYGAYMTDLGNGFALIPIKGALPRFADFTWIGTITDPTQLPGYIDANLTILDWAALNSYEVNYMDMETGTIVNPDPTHNTSTVTRTGIQYNDVFRMGDSYYKFTYNGWKFYSGKWQSDYVERKWGVQLLITPDNGGELQDENGCPNQNWIVKGVNVNRCGTEWIVVNDTSDGGRYFLLNLRTGFRIEGTGNASLSCLYCWAVVRVNGVTNIYGANGILYTTNNSIYGVSHIQQPYTVDDIPYMFLKVYEYIPGSGGYTTVLKCDSNLGTWHTSVAGASTIQANTSIQYVYTQFLGLYNIDNQHVIVIENDTIVYDDIGIIESGWGQSIGRIRTGQFIDIITIPATIGNDTVYGRYRTVDLISGKDGWWIGTRRDGDPPETGNVNPNDYNVVNGTIYYGSQTYAQFAINPDSSGNKQSMWIGAYAVNPTYTQTVRIAQGGEYSWVSTYTYFHTHRDINYGTDYTVPHGLLVLKITYQGNTNFIINTQMVDSRMVRSQMECELIEYKGSTLRSNTLTYLTLTPSGTSTFGFGRLYACTTNMPSNVSGIFIYNYWMQSGNIYQPTTLNVSNIFFGVDTLADGEYTVPPPDDVIPEWETVTEFSNDCAVSQPVTSGFMPYALTNCSECCGALTTDSPQCARAFQNGLIYNSYSSYYSALKEYSVAFAYKQRNSPPVFLSIYKDGTIEWDVDASGQAKVLTEPIGWENKCDPPLPIIVGTCGTYDCAIRRGDDEYVCGRQQGCQYYSYGTSGFQTWTGTINYTGLNNGKTITIPGARTINLLACCTDHDMGHAAFNYIIQGDTTIYERMYIDGNEVATQSYDPANYTSVTTLGFCTCGFVYAKMGIQDKVTGDITYTVEPAYYTNTGFERITSALQIPPEMEQDISLSCCNGYGWALVRKGAEPVISWGTSGNPLIPSKDPQYTPPAVTDANLDTYLSDPRCTIATFDDGTQAVGRWGAYFMTYCDGADAGADRWVDTWHFRGIDGVFKTVQNPYRLQHNPMGEQETNQSWVPFAWTKPDSISSIFKIDADGYFDGLIEQDTDIIAQRCNFYDTDLRMYRGMDVTTQVGDLDHDFNVSMTWPDPNEVICEPGTVIEYSTLAIRKTINNPYNAGSFDTVQTQPFMRYSTGQLTRNQHVGEKGTLTNTQYQGRMEIIDSSVKTSTYSDYDDLEQKSASQDRQGHYYMVANDREAIKPADELMGYSGATVTTSTVVKDLKINLPYPEYDQQRSVFAENGHVCILDRDLGLMKYDYWGNVST